MNWDLIYKFSIVCILNCSILMVQAQRIDTTIIPKPAKIYTYKNHKIWLAPACLITTSALVYGSGKGLSDYTIRDAARQLTGPGFHTRIDDILWFVPACIAFGAPAFGQPTSQTTPDKLQTFMQTQVFTFLLIYPTKAIVARGRPLSNLPESWPSGHTGQAFACATFMHHQLQNAHWSYKIAAYSLATTTGALRILNDKHYASDVLAGAALGVFSGNLAWYLQKYSPDYNPIKGWKVQATPVFEPYYGLAIRLNK